MLNSINFIKSHELKSNGKIVAISKDYTGVEVDNKYFKKILEHKNAELYAIDGGSSIVADGGGWIIALLRVAIIGYDSYKKVAESKKEYTLTIVHGENYELLLEDGSNILQLRFPDLSNEEIEDIPAIIMKLLEWKTCLELAKKKNCLIVMDSALEPDNNEEKELINELKKNNSTIIGFCKSSRLRTNTGRSFLGLVNNMMKGEWYYYPVFIGEKDVKTFIAKFNNRTKFCNKVQVFSKEKDIDSFFSILAFFSHDSEMLGYPYPLIKADKVARITGYEKKKFESKLSRLLKKAELEYDLYSQSMHAELDKRMYRNLNQKS